MAKCANCGNKKTSAERFCILCGSDREAADLKLFAKVGGGLTVLFIGVAIASGGSSDSASADTTAADAPGKFEAQHLAIMSARADSIVRNVPVSAWKEMEREQRDHFASIVQRYGKGETPELAEWKSKVERVQSAETAAALAREERERAALHARQDRALGEMKRKKDEFQGVTWYQDPTHPRYSDNNTFRLYFGTKPGEAPHLRLLVRYSGDDWLFVERWVVLADEQRFEIDPPSHFSVERDNGGGDVWEWYDIPAGASDIAMAEAMHSARRVRIRAEGKQYHRDRDLSANERRALRRVLDAYAAAQRGI